MTAKYPVSREFINKRLIFLGVMGDIIFRKVLKKILSKERSPIHQLTKNLLDFGYPIVSYSPTLPEVTSYEKVKKYTI